MQASPAPATAQPRIVGRYALYGEIAAGGMATVHFGRLVGAVGFSRTVAIKRLHAQFSRDPDFVAMFLDEARLVSRIQHPNVVTTIDVVPLDEEIFLVMEYVHGEALSKLIRAARRRGELVPPRIALSIMAGALHGLHAAHEAKSERGEPLNIVHRDVSPQNILVGTDGVPRVLDFGVAKAAARATSTRDGSMKGKVSYMAPEQLRGRGVDRRTDIFAAGVVLWEALTGRRLFDGDDQGEILAKLLEAEIPAPSEIERSIPAELDQVVMRSLTRDINQRWKTAREFAIALEHCGPIALPREVGEWVEAVGGETIPKRAALLAQIESLSSSNPAVMQSLATYPSSPSHAQPMAAVPTSWPVATGEPITSPSQVSHVTGISRPSAPSATTSPSQMSQLSQISGYEPQQSGGRSLHAALIGIATALGIALIAMVVVLVGRHRAQQAELDRPAPPPPPVTTSAPAVEAPPAPAEASEPSVPPIVSVQPSTTAAPDLKVSPLPAVQAPKIYRPPPKSGGTKAGSKSAESNCDPPFFVDANGVRRVKPACM